MDSPGPWQEARDRFRMWAWRHYVDGEFAHPRLSYLFWEATLGCNLACRHCGSDCHRSSNVASELTGDEAVRALTQVAQDFGPRNVFLAVTGGEPLVRPDLFEVMGRVSRLGFAWGMVSNGWAVDDAVVAASKATRMRTLVISLDGVTRESHDWLRGAGSFDRAVDALDRYRRAGFLKSLQVTTTYHRRNIGELQAMYDFLVRKGIRDWRIVSVFPNGRAQRQSDFLLEPAELQRLLDFIRDKRSKPRPIKVSYGDEGVPRLRLRAPRPGLLLHVPRGRAHRVDPGRRRHLGVPEHPAQPRPGQRAPAVRQGGLGERVREIPRPLLDAPGGLRDLQRLRDLQGQQPAPVGRRNRRAEVVPHGPAAAGAGRGGRCGRGLRGDRRRFRIGPGNRGR